MRRLIAAASLLMTAACGASDGSRVAPAPVTVFAAASLKGALDEIDVRVTAPAGHALRLTYAGTPALARQIEAGAPADIFIAADEGWMDHVQRAGYVQPATRVTLLGNTLVLITPAATPASASLADGASLRAALADGRLAIADPDGVPAGRYAREALIGLGVWADVQGRLAPHENVRAALALVARGEAPLGIVYASDAVDEPRVRVIERISPASHAPVRYPAALTTGAGPGAADVLRALLSTEARAVFVRHGFEVPAR